MSKIVTVEIEIPDGAILGPAMVITYAQPVPEAEQDKEGQVKMELHASARYDPVKARALKYDHVQQWFYAMHRALADGITHGSGH